MQTSVTFKNLDSSDALKSYVRKKLDRFDKLLDGATEANVVLSVEKIRHIAEIKMVCDRLNIQARESTDNMYTSIDRLMDKIKMQINKSKDKIRNQTSGARDHIKGEIPEVIQSADEEAPDPQIWVRQMDYKPMDIDEAMLQMDLTPDHFIVFTNSQTEQVNVLYKRDDGHFDLIQPLA
jgi:putative sigma-54 modulation protein